MERSKKREKGFILILALAILFILLILAVSLLWSQKNLVIYTNTARNNNLLDNTVRITQMRFIRTILPTPVPVCSPSGKPFRPFPVPLTGSFEVDPFSRYCTEPERIEEKKKLTEEEKEKYVVPYTITVKYGQGESIYRPVQEKAGSNITKIPEVGYSREKDWEKHKGYGDLYVPPWHSYLAMKNNYGERHLSMFSGAFPYGICAPNGKIEAKTVSSYSNPTIKEVKNLSDEDRSYLKNPGIPANLIAGKDIEVDDFVHGRAYSRLPDSIRVKGGGTGFSGQGKRVGNIDDILKFINEKQLRPLFDELSRNTLDKSGLITGKGAPDIGNLRDSLDIRFFIIPRKRLINIKFHCPYPPDLASTAKGNSEWAGFEEKWKGFLTEPGAAMKDELETDETDDEETGDGNESPIDKKSEEFISDYQRLLSGEKSSQTENSAKDKGLTGKWDEYPGPTTWSQEQNFRTTGFPYFQIIYKGIKLFISGSISEKVRVIHYRGESPDISFNSGDGGFDWLTNLTVPRGRTLKLRGNVKIRGDIWIQQGATLYIDGSLTTENPFYYGRGGKGMLFMERGASLVVEKDLILDGDPWAGSIVIDSPVDGVEYISSAILVKGKAVIPYGIMPGITFHRLAGYIKENRELENFFKTLQDSAPHVSKIIGPFHYRKCFFAKYCATFTMIKKVPVPIPNPLNNNGARVLFNAYTYNYHYWLNRALGENFYTDAGWWIIDNGLAPFVPKVAGIDSALLKLQTMAPGRISPETGYIVLNHYVRLLDSDCGVTRAKIYITQITTKLLTKYKGVKKKEEKKYEFVKNVVSEVEQMFSPGRSKVLKEIHTEMEDKQKQAISSATGDEGVLFESAPGILIHTGGKLTIGIDGSDKKAYFASGLFISSDDMNINAVNTVGCLMSIKGNVKVKNFYYYPYFTRASINIPRKLSFNDNFYHLAPPESDKTMDVGINCYHMTAQGWEK